MHGPLNVRFADRGAQGDEQCIAWKKFTLCPLNLLCCCSSTCHSSVLISEAPVTIKMDSLQVSGSSNSMDRKSAVGNTHVPPCSALFQTLYISGEYDCFL